MLNTNLASEISNTKIELNKLAYDYDFKRIFIKNYSNQDIFSNWLKYRSRSGQVDCDASLLATVLLYELWDFDGNIECQVNSKYKYEIVTEEFNLRGDSMTSLYTTFKKYVQLKHPDILVNNHVPNHEKMGGTNTEKWIKFFKDNKDYISVSEDMKEFMLLYNTVGNMLPVPIIPGVKCSSFNSSRSNCGKFDYADLMLVAIFNWYVKNDLNTRSFDHTDDSDLKKLLQSNKYAIYICKKWLVHFKNWDNFVERNYLQAFIKGDSRPMMLWSNHSFENPIPKSLEEIKEFLRNVNKMIEERGMSMIKVISD